MLLVATDIAIAQGERVLHQCKEFEPPSGSKSEPASPSGGRCFLFNSDLELRRCPEEWATDVRSDRLQPYSAEQVSHQERRGGGSAFEDLLEFAGAR